MARRRVLHDRWQVARPRGSAPVPDALAAPPLRPARSGTAPAVGSTPALPALRGTRRSPVDTSRAGSPRTPRFSAGSPAAGKGLAQHGLGLRVLLVVVLRDREQVVRTDPVDKQVGAVGESVTSLPPWNDAPAPIRSGTPPPCAWSWSRPCSIPSSPSCGRRPPRPARREADERLRIRDVSGVSERIRGIPSCASLRPGTRRPRAGPAPSRCGSRIDDQHRIPRFGQPPAHLLEGGPQTERIGPDQHARMRTARGAHEVAVRRAVGGRHIDIRGCHLQRSRRSRQEHGQSRSDRQRSEFAAGQVSRRKAQVVLLVTVFSRRT